MSKKTYVDSFKSIQFLRFIAAFLVVISHADDFYAARAGAGNELNAYAYIFAFGHVGVHIFFVISGFVMVTATFGKNAVSWQNFLFRRFIRIYPIYWVYALLFIAFLYARGGSLDPGSALLSSLLVPGYSSLIINQGWTLSYEVYFYICFASCMWLGMNRTALTLAGFFSVSILLHRLVPTQPILDVITNPLLMEFIFGVLIAVMTVNGRRLSATASRSIIYVSIAGYAVGVWVGYSRLPSLIMWGLPSAALILGAVMLESSSRLPTWIKTFSWLGDSSYSLYLLHPIPLLFVIASTVSFKSTTGTLRVMVCIVASTVACSIAIIAFKFIERPLTKFLSRLLHTSQPLDQHPRLSSQFKV
jgi:exopolysaccharide production protein ExoZ